MLLALGIHIADGKAILLLPRLESLSDSQANATGPLIEYSAGNTPEPALGVLNNHGILDIHLWSGVKAIGRIVP
jgi:hypothetical protein